MATAFENIAYEVTEHEAWITINRPETLNALDIATLTEIEAAVERAERDDDVRVVIFTGAGERAFIAGGDIADLDSRRGLAHYIEFAEVIHRVFRRIELCDKPTIAAVNGWALGGGAEIMLVNDIRVLAAEARVGVPEITLGIFPGAGGSQRLMRQIPPCRAREMMFTGDQMSPQEAYDFGLVNHVVPRAELVDKVKAIAGKIKSQIPADVEAAQARHGTWHRYADAGGAAIRAGDDRPGAGFPMTRMRVAKPSWRNAAPSSRVNSGRRRPHPHAAARPDHDRGHRESSGPSAPASRSPRARCCSSSKPTRSPIKSKADRSGVLGEIVIGVGETVDVGTVVGLWVGAEVGATNTVVPSPANNAVTSAHDERAAPALAPRAHNGRIVATPHARKLARKHDLDLSVVRGSGPKGRIKADDVLRLLQAPPADAAAGERRALSPHQRAVGKRMQQASREIPHFHLTADADIGALLDVHRRLQQISPYQDLTITHWIVSAVGMVLTARIRNSAESMPMAPTSSSPPATSPSRWRSTTASSRRLRATSARARWHRTVRPCPI